MPPFVSIIVPCYNEETTIGLLLNAILAQSYPRAQLEVIIADGHSQDNSVGVIKDFQSRHGDLAIRVVENRERSIPTGLNLAMTEARGDIFVRLDAHSMPIPEYVTLCVQALRDGKGSNVGGVWIIEPGAKTWIADAIAAAAAHPLGVGDALYRLNSTAGPVDTVPFGAFRRELLEKIGNFDESLLSNEDYEFNTRIRRSGGIVWLEPHIRSTYVARATLWELARQYWRYGYWKYKMLRRYPDTLRWRQALPPLFVFSILALGILSIFSSLGRQILAAEILAYLVILFLAGLALSIHKRRAPLMPGLVLAIVTMHLFWGSGFLWSFITTPVEHHV